jgi:glutamate racemase
LSLDKKQPIGIFDSGIGGLTVANAFSKVLPEEQILYFGDTAHLPYGDKSPEAILGYSIRISHMLMDMGCKLVVIACNTASSVAYGPLMIAHHNEVGIFNVIDPLVKGIAAQKDVKKVGVIGTKGTISSGVYEKKLKTLRPDLEVVSLATPLLVPMIEEGFVHNKISHSLIQEYLDDPRFENIDSLVLACTHYPLIRPEIEEYYNGRVKVYDSTDFTVEAVKRHLVEQNILNERKDKEHRFFVSDYTKSFEQTTRLFYGEAIHLEHLLIWENEQKPE